MHEQQRLRFAVALHQVKQISILPRIAALLAFENRVEFSDLRFRHSIDQGQRPKRTTDDGSRCYHFSEFHVSFSSKNTCVFTFHTRCARTNSAHRHFYSGLSLQIYPVCCAPFPGRVNPEGTISCCCTGAQLL